MNNYEKIKQLSPTDFAYFVCIDNEGNDRSCCPLCKRFYQDNCDDRCVNGVSEWLQEESEKENE